MRSSHSKQRNHELTVVSNHKFLQYQTGTTIYNNLSYTMYNMHRPTFMHTQ